MKCSHELFKMPKRTKRNVNNVAFAATLREIFCAQMYDINAVNHYLCHFGIIRNKKKKKKQKKKEKKKKQKPYY